MRITFDPSKRRATLAERGLDFRDAARVFEGPTLEVEDRRKDYGETRIVCFGYLAGAAGGRGLHTARLRSSRLQYEESQCPRKSACRPAP